ncbi:MAG TPA: hypothetical protein VLA21_04665 [Candidatus Limnocylindria bacterium]|nr:hypothetical protein [Candidatus Limnocylindria bacterium]
MRKTLSLALVLALMLGITGAFASQVQSQTAIWFNPAFPVVQSGGSIQITANFNATFEVDTTRWFIGNVNQGAVAITPAYSGSSQFTFQAPVVAVDTWVILYFMIEDKDLPGCYFIKYVKVLVKAPVATPTPTMAPTPTPTMAPTPTPTMAPTPTLAPTDRPAPTPTLKPTRTPYPSPSVCPVCPTPTATPTMAPTPTLAPTDRPGPTPTLKPTHSPYPTPTLAPTPTLKPTARPGPTPTADPEPRGCPAAPAVAARILREANIRPNSDAYQNLISQVAQHMGPTTDFNGIEKCDTQAYYNAIYAFLKTNGATLP